MIGSGGLKSVSTKDLKAILRLVFKEELECPITQIGLATNGMLRLGDDLQVLRGLDAKAVHAVIVSVLSERPRG